MSVWHMMVLLVASEFANAPSDRADDATLFVLGLVCGLLLNGSGLCSEGESDIEHRTCTMN